MTWTVDGTTIDGFVEESRIFDQLTITWRVSESTVTNTIRPILQGTGKVQILPRSVDGGFDVEDRSRGRSEVTLSTSRPDSDVRPVDTWYVQEYEETQRGAESDSWEVEVVFVPEKEKAYDNTYSTSPTSDSTPAPSNKFQFDLQAGSVVTGNVTSDLSRTPDGEIENVELTFYAQSNQIRIIEESLSKINAVNYREIPDGPDAITDENGDSANTITVTPADGADVSVPSGDYVVREWETIWNNLFYTVTISMTKV